MIKGPIHDLELLICVNLFYRFPTSTYNPAILGNLSIFQACLFHLPLNISECSAHWLSHPLLSFPYLFCITGDTEQVGERQEWMGEPILCEIYDLTPLPGQWEARMGNWSSGGRYKLGYFLLSISATGSFSGSAAWPRRCQFSVSRLFYGSVPTWQPRCPTSIRHNHLFSLSLQL